MKKLVFAVILAVLFSACGDTSGGKTSEPSVYIGGSFMDNGVEKACYWVDEKRYELNGDAVFNIIAIGNTVYAAGKYTADGVDKACYWVNGVRRDLPGLSIIDGIDAYGQISVDSGNVYVCGMYDGNGNEDNKKVSYWVNGIRFEPPANGIDVYAANGSVYIVGSYTDGGIFKPCYWVNGVRKGLPNIAASIPDWIVGTITVVNNRIYIACIFGTDSDIYSSYWIDGVQQKILTKDYMIIFAVSEGNVYTAGGLLYINGELSDIEYGFFTNNAAFAVSRGKVYTCFWDWESETACYWIDGEQFFLDGAYANAIFVKE